VLCSQWKSRRVATKGIRDRLLALEKKLAAGQLHLAVLGQMKRGKSSFINALLGAEIRPTGVLPVTAIITEIRYGPVTDATIIYATGGLRESIAMNTLADYITEDGNPGNRKQVGSVEIAYPSSFLEGGVVLIDTPGIGSTHAHNTQTTEGYLEQIDAGIVAFFLFAGFGFRLKAFSVILTPTTEQNTPTTTMMMS
jgi:ribosome biogenesis GTPase A